MDDEGIVGLYWERAEAAIGETALKYGAFLFKIAQNILHDKEDSDECVNDTYLKAWNAMPPERPLSLPAFLGRITRNLSLNKYKARNAKKRGGGSVRIVTRMLDELGDCIPSNGGGVGEGAEYETGEIADIINSFLYSITYESRVVFVRRYWYADSIAGIAGRFNISESKVKSMLYRTRLALKAWLEDEGVKV